MKKTIGMITLCFLLAIAAPFAAAAGESTPPETQMSFSMDSGVTWDSSIEEIVALEGEPDPESSGLTDAYQLLYYGYKPVGQNHTAELALVLNNAGELMVAAYNVSDVRAEDFAALQDELSAVYGLPAEPDMRRFLGDMGVFGMFATYEEYQAVADDRVDALRAAGSGSVRARQTPFPRCSVRTIVLFIRVDLNVCENSNPAARPGRTRPKQGFKPPYPRCGGFIVSVLYRRHARDVPESQHR